MNYYFIIFIICIIAVALFFYLRNRYDQQSAKLDIEISNIPAYHNPNSYETAKERLELEQNRSFDNLEAILEHSFKDHIISETEKEDFTNQYGDIFNEAYSLKRKLDFFHLEPAESIVKLIDDYGSIHRLVKNHNEQVIKEKLENNREFFDHCLSYPLDEQQRRSIVSEEDNCLVVSSAGSGKTSSIVGKVKYLIERKGIATTLIHFL